MNSSVGLDTLIILINLVYIKFVLFLTYICVSLLTTSFFTHKIFLYLLHICHVVGPLISKIPPLRSSQILSILFKDTYMRIYRVSQEKWTKFGRVFLMLNYTDITQNTYIQSWTVTKIGHRKVWASRVFMYCTPSVTPSPPTAHARQLDTTS